MTHPHPARIAASLCAVSLLFAGCGIPPNETNASSSSTSGQPELNTETSNESSGDTGVSQPPPQVEEVTYVAEKIDPIAAQLTSQNPKSKINVRSQPSTRSTAKHYGIKGDRVTLLKQAQGEGDYLWYYLRFKQSQAEGWVRSDFVAQGEQELLSRQSYRPFDFQGDPWLNSFNTDYQAAQQTQADWIEHPTQVAERLAGYPNPDGCRPDNVSTVKSQDPNWVTVLIQSGASQRETCQGDDSVAASEIRVDLIYTNQIWEIDWAGGRYRCREGRGQQDFAPALCS